MTQQREFKFRLPIGYTDENKKVHREATLRKMRGHDEALLADTTLNPGQLVTELIRSCLIKLGDLESIDSAMISKLYTADRNYLLLELRRITLGDHLRTHYQCPRCEADLTVDENLSALEVKKLDEDQALSDISVTLKDGYVDRKGTLQCDLELCLPRGVDEEFVSTMFERDPNQTQEAFLLRCIKRFGSLKQAELEAYGIKILRDLTLGDRQHLKHALNGQNPGVNFQRDILCQQCQIHFEGILDTSNFFFQ